MKIDIVISLNLVAFNMKILTKKLLQNKGPRIPLVFVIIIECTDERKICVNILLVLDDINMMLDNGRHGMHFRHFQGIEGAKNV